MSPRIEIGLSGRRDDVSQLQGSNAEYSPNFTIQQDLGALRHIAIHELSYPESLEMRANPMRPRISSEGCMIC